MNHKIYFLLLFFLPNFIFGNSAQPGIWNAGGTGNFSLLYPEDSASFKKIQMQREQVSIQLYKNYAVVKGEYWLVNSTEKKIELKVGYPINTIFKSQNNRNRADIEFDSLYQLSVYINNTLIEKKKTDSVPSISTWKKDNWYIWNMQILPKDTTLVTLYFIVRTDNTIVSKGYTRNHPNGFMYILETGSIWKQPIENGKIIVELKDDISLKSIKGIAPDSIFNVDKERKIFYYEFNNLSPTSLNNIIITYNKRDEKFNFNSVIANNQKLYQSIDELSLTDISTLKLEQKHFNSPFDVESGFLVTFILLLIVIVISNWYIILLILVLLFFLNRYLKKRKNK